MIKDLRIAVHRKLVRKYAITIAVGAMSNEDKAVVIVCNRYLIALCRRNFSHGMRGNEGVDEDASTEDDWNLG